MRTWSDFLRERGGAHEILLVGASEVDVSPVPGLKILSTEGRQGLGVALRVGLSAAALPLVACAPCDPRYQPRDLQRLFEQIDQVHLVSAFRAGRRVPWPLRALGGALRLTTRLVVSWAPRPLPGWLGWRGYLHAWLARVFFGVRLRDVGCPFLLCRRHILARAPLQSDGDFCLTELFAKVNFTGCYLGEEVPVSVEAQSVPSIRGQRRQTLREAARVFSHPDFGPPHLAAVELAAAPRV